MNVPSDAELWFDTADMPLLREDARDAADIEGIKATTICKYVQDGFTPESAVAAVIGQNVNLLKHTGLVSVQLLPPGMGSPTNPNPEQIPAGTN
jgi:ABC-type branched-subunit amino acid transport system substrate-binding protein